MILQTFEPNIEGRDIVIGDLHGKLSLLHRLLEHLGFDSTKDRLFSLGDPVDRGEDNIGCLRLLNQHGVHMLHSNHGELVLEAFFGANDSILGASWITNGGGKWGMQEWMEWHGYRDHGLPMSTETQELINLLGKLRELPLLMTINHRNGQRYHLVHAELPYLHTYEPITDHLLADPAQVEAMSQRRFDRYGLERCLLWLRDMFGMWSQMDFTNEDQAKRKIAGTAYHHKVNMREIFTDQLGHVISGHTIVTRPFTMVGQTNIDTGGYKCGRYKWAGLTALVLDDWTFWRARDEGVEQVQPFVMTHEDFESYGTLPDHPTQP